MALLLHRFLASLMALTASAVYADQTVIRDYAETRSRHFYGLYIGVAARDAADVYCGVRFTVSPSSSGSGYQGPGKWLNIEHAYPAQWMANSLGCLDRKICPKDPGVGERFDRAEADMHNMWPALAKLNSSRGQRHYAEIVGETPMNVDIGETTFTCDFENDGTAVEPRSNVRGNLARSIFYMCKEYGFPVPKGMMPLLRKWNRNDPPTRAERTRAERIAEIQGTRNPFIDDPRMGDAVKCKSANW